MDLGLQGQKALIMGANRGIGYQIAETLAAEGADVGIFARSEERLQEAAYKIHKVAGKRPLVLSGDSRKNEDIEMAVQKTHQRFGRIDILVNCIGGYTPGSFMEMSDETLMGLMETKWLGYIRAMRAVIPIMREQKSGHILNLAGNSGKNPGYPHAGSANASVINITKVVADEVGPDRILVNCIAPGITLTEHAQHIMETQAKRNNISYEESVKRIADKIPLGFLGEPQDVADLAVFLVSPRNRWITGTAISVDGGTNRSVF
jgi:3-oxoacyl-[acyl-carrier protein] reductase